jgi:uncharacterized protein YbbK (DUF523 family)
MSERLRIGVSACLLGENVRYDGGHKLEPVITGILGELFGLVAICPETGCGLSVPREPMRLEGNPAAPNLVVISTAQDLTHIMEHYCREETARLAKLGLSGFIFKARSPSCGLSRVEVFEGGKPGAIGRGLFAAAMAARFPMMPMEEEEQLRLPEARESFIRRLLDYGRKGGRTGR